MLAKRVYILELRGEKKIHFPHHLVGMHDYKLRIMNRSQGDKKKKKAR